MKVKVSEIHWDIDDEYKDDYKIVKDEEAMTGGEEEITGYLLPESMVVDVEDEDEAIDACSDKYGWCIFTATIEVIA